MSILYKSRKFPNARIDVADALRGIAVAGIILIHSIEHFNIFVYDPVPYTLPSDGKVAEVLYWLFSGKMYCLFAMLFGLSFFIMNDNHQQRGQNFSLRFAWRMLLLFAFGLVNMALYDGDVLMMYACFGLILIPLSYLPSWMVWTVIALLAIQPLEVYSMLTGWHYNTDEYGRLFGEITHQHTQGDFFTNTLYNLKNGFISNVHFFLSSGRFTQLLCMFVLGMQLGRHRFFYNEGRHLLLWHILAIVCLALVIVEKHTGLGEWWPVLSPMMNFVILMLIVSIVVCLWYDVPVFRRVLAYLCSYGRMSLTAYVMQSAIGSLLFCHYGFCLYNKLGTTYSALVGLGIIAFIFVFSRLWFRKYQRGPLESIWRYLTYKL